jgi:ribosomal protein S18 acetylase RimI-like enzyme
MNKTGSERSFAITLELVPLSQPYIKRWGHSDADTLALYQRLPQMGFSFGAYNDQECVGLALGEPRQWNKSLWVYELHVVDDFHRHRIGQQLVETLSVKARATGLRIVVCETQNTNVPAIQFYRKMGFEIEGIDLSYYSNEDYSDGEIAIFMKKRLV